MTKEKTIKFNIKNKMVKENITIHDLSIKTNINISALFFLLYSPLHKVRLTQAISICKALNLNLTDIV